jgi:hypothetical protein
MSRFFKRHAPWVVLVLLAGLAGCQSMMSAFSLTEWRKLNRFEQANPNPFLDG